MLVNVDEGQDHRREIMLDMTDQIESGYRCEDCSEIIDGDEPGYSRVCNDCADDAFEDE